MRRGLVGGVEVEGQVGRLHRGRLCGAWGALHHTP
jgi:hypothetical protein